MKIYVGIYCVAVLFTVFFFAKKINISISDYSQINFHSNTNLRTRNFLIFLIFLNDFVLEWKNICLWIHCTSIKVHSVHRNWVPDLSIVWALTLAFHKFYVLYERTTTNIFVMFLLLRKTATVNLILPSSYPCYIIATV